MLFTSGVFLAFLLVVFGVYYTLRGIWQLRWLIAASLFFYAFDNPPLLVLLLAVATIDVVFSRRVAIGRHPRAWAAAGVTINLLVLAFFKYNRLLVESFPSLVSPDGGAIHTLLSLPLPIGISFYTFHGISLLLDTFRPGAARANISSARNFSDHVHNTLLYVSFFPQLIAGPIVKAHHFYPQIASKHLRGIAWEDAIRALIVGYFLKQVVADNLAQLTSTIAYPYFLSYSTVNLLIMLAGYSAQIFADFAGYSLIAIGLGRLFGYNLPTNFLFPYISETFSEFWTRWHISLSSWLREYLYYPLGGNRKGPLRTYVNLMLVMVLGGLWHGAAWSYAIWGFWHGAALVVERACRNGRLYASQALAARIARTAIVLCVVTLGWLLFKLPEFTHVIGFLRSVASNTRVAISPAVLLLTVLYILPVALYHMDYLARRHAAKSQTRYGFDGCWRSVALGILLSAIVLNPGPPQSFIYFQF